MNIERQLNGSILCTEMVGDICAKQTYYGYTKAEAKREFNAYIKQLHAYPQKGE